MGNLFLSQSQLRWWLCLFLIQVYQHFSKQELFQSLCA
jgi:hypothetical protein